MKGHLRDDGADTSRRSKLSALRSRLQLRHRGNVGGGGDSAEMDEVEGGEGRFSGAEAGGDQRSLRLRVHRRAQQAMHRSFVAVATAVIVRASFSPQAASAVGLYRPRLGEGGTSTSRQLRKKQQREEKRMEKIRAQVEKEQQERLDAATSSLNGEISGEQAAAAAATVAGEVEGAAGEVTAAAAAATASATSEIDQLVDKICALPSPQAQERALKRLIPEDYRKAWLKLSTAQRTEITKLRIENKSFKAVSIGDARKRGKRDQAPIAIVFSSFLLFTGMRSSLKIMANQRKRVKTEAAKFDMERDEFMNVDGEAEFDVDIMKELRDMKEKMAGPGDTYAKDTRAYNPEFAAAAGDEDEYDKKIQEALKGTGKGSKTTKGETSKIFTIDSAGSGTAASGKDDDLLGEESDSATDEAGASQGDAGAAAQSKKDADAKRLEDLFNNSSIDDPEDDLGDGRERLP
ncbi:unnamed protein product [Scytosiphon promiscuus]